MPETEPQGDILYRVEQQDGDDIIVVDAVLLKQAALDKTTCHLTAGTID